MVWQPYPTKEEDNLTQLMILRSNKMVILSGFIQTNSSAVEPNFIVFNDAILCLFFITAVLITALFLCKIIIYGKFVKSDSWSMSSFLKRRFLYTILTLNECVFVAQAIKPFMLKYKLGTVILIWTSFNFILFYESFLNTSQVQFNWPHMIESYKQIAIENIKPLFLSAMNDMTIVKSVSNGNSEATLKRLIDHYGKVKNESCEIDVGAAGEGQVMDTLVKIILELPKQREVMIINTEIEQIVKSIFCSFTYNKDPNLKLYSVSDPGAVDANAQVVFGKDFLKKGPDGKKIYQFVYRMYAVARIANEAFKLLEGMRDMFYNMMGAPTQERIVHERQCARNYFEVPDPSVKPMSKIWPSMVTYLFISSFLILLCEINFKNSLGGYLNNFQQTRSRSSRPSMVRNFSIKTLKPRKRNSRYQSFEIS